MMKTSPRTIRRAALLAVLAAGAALLYARLAPPAAAEAEPTARIEPQPLSLSLALVGRIESARFATIAAPFDGEVVRRLYEEGQAVPAGQPLIELSSAELAIRLREALAEKLRAEAAWQ